MTWATAKKNVEQHAPQGRSDPWGRGTTADAKPGHYSDKPVLVSHPHSDAARIHGRRNRANTREGRSWEGPKGQKSFHGSNSRAYFRRADDLERRGIWRRSFVRPRRFDRRIVRGGRRLERQSARSAADKDRARQTRHGAGRNLSPGCAAARRSIRYSVAESRARAMLGHKAQRRFRIGTRGTWPACDRGGACQSPAPTIRRTCAGRSLHNRQSDGANEPLDAQNQASAWRIRRATRSRRFTLGCTAWSAGLVVTAGDVCQSYGLAFTAQNYGTTAGRMHQTIRAGASFTDGGGVRGCTRLFSSSTSTI